MGKRRILLRFDDICPTMNWGQWGRAKKMMDESKVTALLGVVPECTDPDLMINAPKPDFWQYIKELQHQGFAIAMHGYHHQFELKADGLVTRNKISEFAGLPYDVQLDKIKKGKEIFNSHGIKTDIFFAPAHSYDDNTLRALSACGFKYISDGLSRKPYVRRGIILLPCRSGGIPRIKKMKGCVTAVIHAHEWERSDKQMEFNKFQELLQKCSKDIVPFSVFKERKNGWAIIQRADELLYLFLRDKMLPLAKMALKI